MVYLYAYKKKKHLNIENDYSDPLKSSSKSRDAFRYKELSDFKDKFCTEIDCTALEYYLKKQMNNPDSYDPVSVDVKMNDEGDISVIQEFRGQNGFGATITQRAIATMSPDGNVFDCKFF